MLHVGSNKVRLGAIKTARHSVTSYGASSALLFVCLRLFASVSVLLPSTHSHCWSICPDLRSGCPIRVSPFQCNLCLCILLHSSLRVSVSPYISISVTLCLGVSVFLPVCVCLILSPVFLPPVHRLRYCCLNTRLCYLSNLPGSQFLFCT